MVKTNIMSSSIRVQSVAFPPGPRPKHFKTPCRWFLWIKLHDIRYNPKSFGSDLEKFKSKTNELWK